MKNFLVYINAGHDINGNPKRGWLLFEVGSLGCERCGDTAKAIKFFQEDYSGKEGSLPEEFHKLPCTERIRVSPRVFGSARVLNNSKLGKLAALGGAL